MGSLNMPNFQRYPFLPEGVQACGSTVARFFDRGEIRVRFSAGLSLTQLALLKQA